MTEPDPSEPVNPGGGPRGVGESLDAPGADVPAVDDPPAEQPLEGSDTTEAGVAEAPVPVPRPVVLRRAPRYRAFLVTGAIIGAIIGVVLTSVLPDHGGQYSTGAVMGYVSAVLALIGALVGGGAAVLIERRDPRS